MNFSVWTRPQEDLQSLKVSLLERRGSSISLDAAKKSTTGEVVDHAIAMIRIGQKVWVIRARDILVVSA